MNKEKDFSKDINEEEDKKDKNKVKESVKLTEVEHDTGRVISEKEVKKTLKEKFDDPNWFRENN